MLKHSRLGLSLTLLITMLAFLGPGRALAQDATVRIVQEATTRAGLDGVRKPATPTLAASAETGSATDSHRAASIAWTTSILVDVLLLMAAIAGLAAIVLMIWPPIYGRTKLLTLRLSGPKPLTPQEARANRAGSA